MKKLFDLGYCEYRATTINHENIFEKTGKLT